MRPRIIFVNINTGHTDDYAIGKHEEVDAGGEGAQHKASRDHDSTEDGHGPGAEIYHTGTADGTCARKRRLISPYYKQQYGNDDEKAAVC